MKQKKQFTTPLVLQTVKVCLEEGLLAASDLTVQATGQEVDVVEDTQTWD